jgi:hypothetical protein
MLNASTSVSDEWHEWRSKQAHPLPESPRSRARGRFLKAPYCFPPNTVKTRPSQEYLPKSKKRYLALWNKIFAEQITELASRK